MISIIDSCSDQSRIFLDLAKHYNFPFALNPNILKKQPVPPKRGDLLSTEQQNTSSSSTNKVVTAAAAVAATVAVSNITNQTSASSSSTSSTSTSTTSSSSASPSSSTTPIKDDALEPPHNPHYSTEISRKLLLRGLRDVILSSDHETGKIMVDLMNVLKVPIASHSVTLASLKHFFDGIKAGRGLEPIRQAKQSLLTVMFSYTKLTPKILCKEIGIAPYSQSIKNLFAGAQKRASHNAEVLNMKGSLRDRAKKGKEFKFYDPPAKRSDSMDVDIARHAAKSYYSSSEKLSTQIDGSETSSSSSSSMASSVPEKKWVLLVTLEEVRKKWIVQACLPVNQGGLGKQADYTVSRSWFGKQRPSDVKLNPELTGAKAWMKKAAAASAMSSRKKEAIALTALKVSTKSCDL